VGLILVVLMVTITIVMYFGSLNILSKILNRNYRELLSGSIENIKWDIKRFKEEILFEVDAYLKSGVKPENLAYIIKGNEVVYKLPSLNEANILSASEKPCFFKGNLNVWNLVKDDMVIGAKIDDKFIRQISKGIRGNGFVVVKLCNTVITPYFVDKRKIINHIKNTSSEYFVNIEGNEYIVAQVPVRSLSFYTFISITMFKDILSKLTFILGLSLLVGILLVVLVSFYIAKYLSKSFKLILDGFDNLRNGTFEYIDIKTQDELGMIMAEFNVTVAVLKDAMEKMKIAKEMAEEANKAKSMFIASVSHEIRTPLNSILGFAELLLQEESDPKKREYIQTIYNSGEHLLNVINEILDLSKIESGKMELSFEPYNPAKLVEEIVKMYQPIALKKGINLTMKIGKDIPKVAIADPFRVKQIIINLVSNSLKFTHEGYVMISVEKDGDNLIYTVEDTGIGIPKEKLQAIFEPFTQVDATISRKYGGTGLGLTIAKKLAQLMKGDLWMESEVGVGTKAYLKIPVKVVEETETAGKILEEENVVFVSIKATRLKEIVTNTMEDLGYSIEEYESIEKINNELKERIPRMVLVEAEKPSDVTGNIRSVSSIVFLPPNAKTVRLKNTLFISSNITTQEELIEILGDFLKISSKESISIAIVEDNEVNRKLLKKMLDQVINYSEIKEFVNGEEIVKAFHLGENFDVVLMDAQMPVMDGFTASKELTKAGYNGIIIMVSASVTQEDIKKALEAGCDDFVPKPVKMDILRSKLWKYFPIAILKEKSVKKVSGENNGENDSKLKEVLDKSMLESNEHEVKREAKLEKRSLKMEDTKSKSKGFSIVSESATKEFEKMELNFSTNGDVKKAIETLKEEMSMDEEMAIGMVKDYIDFLKRKIKNLEKAIENRDQMLARQVGHDLSGSGGMYGFPEITKIGDAIRKFAKEDNFDMVEIISEKLKEIVDHYEKSLPSVM